MDNRSQLRLGGNLRSDLVPANGRSTGDADSAGDRLRGWRTATNAATARRAYGWTDGQREGIQCCICQVVGDGQVVRRPRWVRQTCGQTDEFYHYSDGSPMIWSVNQWDSNRVVGRPKTDGGSLVRSENTAGGNGPSIELYHGRFVACHK